MSKPSFGTVLLYMLFFAWVAVVCTCTIPVFVWTLNAHPRGRKDLGMIFVYFLASLVGTMLFPVWIAAGILALCCIQLNELIVFIVYDVERCWGVPCSCLGRFRDSEKPSSEDMVVQSFLRNEICPLIDEWLGIEAVLLKVREDAEAGRAVAYRRLRDGREDDLELSSY